MALPPGLIIFDCDGVLVDSEPLSMRVLLETIAEAGAVIDVAQGYESFLGRSLASTTDTLRDDYGVDLGSDALDRMRERLYALFRRELQPVPGVAETLAGLALPFCVASSSQPERIRLSLDVTGLRPFFGDHIFSASMVTHGKPAPDLFLHAAREMRIAPARCIVIEDSPAGVDAAKRAGMPVFAFTGGSHAQAPAHRRFIESLGPDRVFERMADLPELLRGWAEK
ncbi:MULTISPECIES: HAD family hydrolase [Rhodomicrobium]|uniref:HAD family hydrolase n=1 Tax=Rhodomicrobium TaxID=1068 RepID=UPI000B4BE634|nr:MULTISPECIES: HAD family hydrolase [Rhodomicrobium]